KRRAAWISSSCGIAAASSAASNAAGLASIFGRIFSHRGFAKSPGAAANFLQTSSIAFSPALRREDSNGVRKVARFLANVVTSIFDPHLLFSGGRLPSYDPSLAQGAGAPPQDRDWREFHGALQVSEQHPDLFAPPPRR